MATRQVIHIDEEKCIGCGLCVNACPNSALALVDGKARLIGEPQCDGLGACLGECPVGALRIETRQAAVPLTEAAAVAGATAGGETPACPMAGISLKGCPGSAERRFERPAAAADASAAHMAGNEVPSALAHWPIQLHLVNPASPAYQDADVLIAADCTAFSLGSFHPAVLAGRSLMIACPKLDRPTGYMEKLVTLFAQARPRSVTVARMEVPCCAGLVQLVLEARQQAGSDLPVRERIVGVQGGIVADRMHTAQPSPQTVR